MFDRVRQFIPDLGSRMKKKYTFLKQGFYYKIFNGAFHAFVLISCPFGVLSTKHVLKRLVPFRQNV